MAPELGAGWRKAAWFAGYWLASVLALTVVGLVIRWAIS